MCQAAKWSTQKGWDGIYCRRDGCRAREVSGLSARSPSARTPRGSYTIDPDTLKRQLRRRPARQEAPGAPGDEASPAGAMAAKAVRSVLRPSSESFTRLGQAEDTEAGIELAAIEPGGAVRSTLTAARSSRCADVPRHIEVFLPQPCV